jgi:signal transduction histidine kinase
MSFRASRKSSSTGFRAAFSRSAAIAASACGSLNPSPNRELRITRFTPAATRLFNVLEGDLGRPIRDLAPRFVEEDLLPDIQTVMLTETAVERRVHRADVAFLVRVLPYRTLEKTVTGAGVTFVDITDLDRAEGELRKAIEALREADRNKNQFLAMLSHELRNPLARSATAYTSSIAPLQEESRRSGRTRSSTGRLAT